MDVGGGPLIRSLAGQSPVIHETAFVSEFAYVIGDVEIGEGSSVWPGAIIRADMGSIVIGRFTNIQDNSIVHGDADVVIGDYVTVGHKVLCHAKKIGEGSVLGNGAILNDGVVIGDYSFIASGAMLVDNVEIAERSLVVGSPGKAIRTVSERHLERMKWYNEVYQEKTRTYKAEGNLES